MTRIVECAANFSEGRRPEVVNAIADAMASVADVYLLDVQMDGDHNRSVITIAGSPDTIGQAALRGVEAAVRQIDLTTHTGAHPRIGAADVIPFIPMSDVTLDECVDIARRVGQEIAERFEIPVYLYEAAATQASRVQLENIRKGQFELLRSEIETVPERKPDFGPARIHPTAGATVVGARKPLIAFNVNLNTADVGIAKEIARRIRFSSGGFPAVKALGLLLHERNQAQVSMNLTDYEQTSMDTVFQAVKREAEARGVTIASSEIVGLVPQAALDRAAVALLQVENFKPSAILENRLAQVMAESGLVNGSVSRFVESVSSSTPAPGGGSVAALAGALGAALGQMAIGITRSKKNYQQHAGQYDEALSRLAAFQERFLGLVDADGDAYGKVMDAYKIPKAAPDRDQAIQDALLHATEVPAQTAQAAAESLQILRNLAPLIHPNVAPDLEVGLEMLRSALRGGIANVRANLDNIKDPEVLLRYRTWIASLEE